MGCRPEASALCEILIGTQSLTSHLRPTKQESLELRTSNLCFSESFQVILMCTKLEKISSGRRWLLCQRWCACGSLRISSRSENDCHSSSHHFSVLGREKEERECSTLLITFLPPGSFKRVEGRKNIGFSACIEHEVEEGWKFQLSNLKFCHMWAARTWKSYFIASILVFLKEISLTSKTSISIRMFSLLFGTQLA